MVQDGMEMSRKTQPTLSAREFPPYLKSFESTSIVLDVRRGGMDDFAFEQLSLFPTSMFLRLLIRFACPFKA